MSLTSTMSPRSNSGLAVPDCDKYCVFASGVTTFALRATAVREVGLRPKIALVPDSHPMLAGLAHIRNEFVPVLRIAGADSGSNSDDRLARHLVILASDSGPWGFLVDNVIGLLPLEVSMCSEFKGGLSWSAAVMGSATIDHRVVHVLDERALQRFSADALSRFWQQSALDADSRATRTAPGHLAPSASSPLNEALGS
jgi:two-component system chemotaxis response regulator CheV